LAFVLLAKARVVAALRQSTPKKFEKKFTEKVEEKDTRGKDMKKVDHYFSEKQESSFEPKKIVVSGAGLKLEMYSAKGIFSKDELDAGSRVLVQSCIIQHDAKVLDLGCGYGAVGILLKRKEPSIDLTLSDINERAVKLTIMNLELLHLKAKVVKSDGFKNIKEDFDVILLNPPQSAGKAVCFRLIEDSFKHLMPNGSLNIVARPAKGGKTLAAKMQEVFGNVQVIGKGSRFSVYMSVR
jgi:16S rRNA (guanine1207-N2)-methyltransferase